MIAPDNRTGVSPEGLIARPGSSPLEAAALGFVLGPARDGFVLHDGNDFTLAVRPLPSARRAVFFQRRECLALYATRDGDLHLDSALALLRDFLAGAKERGMIGHGLKARYGLKARWRWFLLSDRGGIYLHETVTAEESWKRFARSARLLVLNPENGTVCLSPGHPKNRELSARFRDLLERYRMTPKDLWAREAEKALSLCLGV